MPIGRDDDRNRLIEPMIVKLLQDHVIKASPFCGPIHEILRGAENSPNIAMAFDIGRTGAHYHESFDEIYLVLDGWIDLRLYDAAIAQTSTHHLEANELCVITKGIHHQISAASPTNRLAVITMPRFEPADEQLSEVLN